MSTPTSDVAPASPYDPPRASVEPLAEGLADQSPELWSPKAIALITFLLSFPSTLLLVAINRRRLGIKRFPTALTVSTVLLALTSIALDFVVPEWRARIMNLLLNLGMVFYFRYRVIADIAEYRKLNPGAAPRRRGWVSAVLWSLVGLAVYMAAVFGAEAVAAAWDYYPEE